MASQGSLLDNPLDQILEWRNVTQLQSPDAIRRYRVRVTGQAARLRRQADNHQQNANNEVLVALAERDWAHAMETKSLLEVAATSKRKKRVVSKLAKAVKYMSQLPEPLSLQAQGYSNMLRAALSFEQKQWKRAVQHYSNARVILCSCARVEPELSTMYLEVVSNDIDPALRYAITQSGMQRTLDLATLAVSQVLSNSPALVKLLETDPSTSQVLDQGRNISKDQNPVTQLGPIVWRKHTVESVDAPELALAILNAKKSDAELSEKLMSTEDDINVDIFDQVLLDWQEAIDVARECIEKAESANADSSSAQPFYIVQTYVSFQLLLRRIHRDRLLIRKMSWVTRSDPVRIYDAILQSVSDLKDLPGVHQDTELSQDLDIAQSYFRAKKGIKLAEAHQCAGHTRESLALIAKCKTIMDHTCKDISYQGLLPDYVLYHEEPQQMLEQLEKEYTSAYGRAAHEYLNSKDQSVSSSLCIADSLDIFRLGNPRDVLANLINLSPRLEMVPMKPVLFDLAYNYVQTGQESMDQDEDGTTNEPVGPSSGSSTAETKSSRWFPKMFGGK